MKKITVTMLILLVLVAGTVFYSLSQENIENIIVCSANNETSIIPSSICAAYLVNFRGNKDDIVYLQQGSGLCFIAAIEDKARRNDLFTFFLAKGMDINDHSAIDGLTPLHTAILLNDYAFTRFLLQRGANPDVTDRDRHLNAVQFLTLLQEQDPGTNRNNIAELFAKKITSRKQRRTVDSMQKER